MGLSYSKKIYQILRHFFVDMIAKPYRLNFRYLKN